MSPEFERTVRGLWQLAELGSPQFAPDGSAALTFDDVDVQFTTSDNNTGIVILSEVGSFDGDHSRLDHILGVSFALLASHDVLLTLKEDVLCVSGSYPYDANTLTMLSDILSDVVSAVETLRRLMPQKGPSLHVQASDKMSEIDDFVVFQP